jgi:hypothetical protein
MITVTHSKHYSQKRAAREAGYMNCIRNAFGYTRWTYYVHDTQGD